jgi:hypothetical protein
MTISNAYDGQVDFRLKSIKYEPDATGKKPSKITFGNGSSANNNRYGRPAVSIDNKARFVTHEIIGGKTVRQKIGEEPRELGASGVCIEGVAVELDGLRDAKSATIYSNRLPGKSMKAQIASVSTSPLDDGGAANITQGELLYNWSLKAIEI